MLAIVGRKHSGKTTLVVRLAAELTRRGHRVMTIKHGHHTFNLDPSTTDTYSLPQSQEEFYFSLPWNLMDLCLHGKNTARPIEEVAESTGLTTAQVERLAAMGAALVVSPNADPAVIAATRAAGMDSWPGVMTPTEAFAALAAGATGLKLFPASLVGPAGLSALRAVLPPEAPVYAVGGADASNFAEWRTAGAAGFGIGSALYRPGQTPERTAAAAAEIVAAYDAAMADTGRRASP